MRKLVLLVIALAVASCATLKETETEHTTTHVTVWTETYPMEVSVHFPDIYQQVVVRDSSSHLENQYAKSDARIERMGLLYHTLETIPQEIPTKIDVPIQHKDSIVYRDRVVYKDRPVPRQPTAMERLKIGAFWWLCGALALCLLWIFRKTFFKIL